MSKEKREFKARPMASKIREMRSFRGYPCLVCGKEITLRNQPQGYVHKQYGYDCEKDAQQHVLEAFDSETRTWVPDGESVVQHLIESVGRLQDLPQEWRDVAIGRKG